MFGIRVRGKLIPGFTRWFLRLRQTRAAKAVPNAPYPAPVSGTGTVHAAIFPGVEPEVDGATRGSAMAGGTGLAPDDLLTVLELVPCGVVVVDRQGRPLLTNHVAQKLIRGLTSETMPLARALRGETVSDEEHVLSVDEDGEQVLMRVSSSPLRSRGGAITGAVSVCTDIAAGAALQRSQQRLRLALEAGRMGTWDYDVVHDRVEFSTEMTRMTGRPAAAFGSSAKAALLSVHHDDRAAVAHTFREALEHGLEVQFEARVSRAQSSRGHWILAKGRVFRDKDGRAVRVTGISLDITDRKEVEATRQAMAHGERLRALGEMASGIAHDLNQSLALITGYTDMVRQELNLAVPEVGRVRDMIDITARAALDGGKALRGLLSFVRTQDLMSEIERIEVAQVLDDVAQLSAPRWRDKSQAEGRPIHLQVRSEGGCWINGSSAELREAITNLIFNAVDALPQGGTIYLRSGRHGEHVVIEVNDTGVGMSPEVQARAFDPFFSTKGELGTGLGLSQVLAIVEKHGGTIELESAVLRGTTFRLRFPRASAPAASTPTHGAGEPPEPARSVAGAQTSASSRPRGARVLVVEDEEQLARMARIVLTQHGHQVVVASSGDEGLERLDEQSFDLVISDLGLGPGKNGWDLAGEVRERWPGTRFVLVTGWGAAIDPREAQARGVHEVIAKPYRIADLRQIADHVAQTLSNE
jgi:PAS domain S-box-containing protein